MTISIEEVRAFITDARKDRQNWLTMAERSWREIKKRQQNNRLWNVTPNSLRKRNRYPAWFSIFKIRQPLLLSRIGVPIGKDTTQDGNDNVGATAAICLERLAINLARSFDFFSVMAAGRDDFLATNFAQCRAYYERDTVTEPVKEYITPEKDPDTQEMVFIDSKGNTVTSNEIGQDDEGFFLEHEETVDVDNEKVCLRPVLYSQIYVDPGILDWEQCERIAFEIHFSEPQFKQVFGVAAYTKLSLGQSTDDSQPKRQTIKVFEYWDKYEKQCYWLPETGDEFLTPKGYLVPGDDADEYTENEYGSGLYNLEKIFPCPKPLIINAPTDEFWPIPEYYQVVEILEDIHMIFSRMVTATRAYRSRLLYDSSIDGLQSALNEASEADAIGITNLGMALSSGGGDLKNFAQYINTEGVILSLQQLYQSLEQRLQSLFKLTGTSDLLQGLTTTNTDKTLGERQMEEKYAINQLAEYQRKMQEYVRDSYQLLCEMALKNFKDSSLDKYIMPQTLDEDNRSRYRAAIGMLKENEKRFRIELETDSTIAINEQFDKAMRIELVNILTAALEKTANVAATQPGLVKIDLHAMKYLIQGFRQGKMFQTEITQAIDDVIKQLENTPPGFNKDQEEINIKKEELKIYAQEVGMKAGSDQAKVQIEGTKAQTEQMAAMTDAQVKQRTIALKEQVDAMASQLAVLMYQLDAQKAGVELQNKMDDNRRLWAEVQNEAMDIGVRAQTEKTKGPQVVVIPQAQQPQQPIIVMPQAAQPAAGPTIINAPNQPPQTSVIQPVQEVPVPMMQKPPGIL